MIHNFLKGWRETLDRGIVRTNFQDKEYVFFLFSGDIGDGSRMQELDFWKEKSLVGGLMFTADEDMECSAAVSQHFSMVYLLLYLLFINITYDAR